MDYTERLRRMANNDAAVAADLVDEVSTEPKNLDPKTLGYDTDDADEMRRIE